MIAKFNKYVVGVPDKGERESLGRINPWRNACPNFPQLTKDMKPWIKKCYEAPKNKLNIYKQNDIPAYSITT